MAGGAEEAIGGGPPQRRCGNCRETGHNARTCKKDSEGPIQLDSQ